MKDSVVSWTAFGLGPITILKWEVLKNLTDTKNFKSFVKKQVYMVGTIYYLMKNGKYLHFSKEHYGL